MHRKTWLCALGLVAATGLVVLGACVGDDPATVTTNDDSGGGPDGSGITDGNTGDGGGGDSSVSDAGDKSCRDAAGNFVGARAFGFVGTNKSITGTSNGGNVMVGGFRQAATYGDAAPMPGTGNTEEASVVRFKPDGALLWQQHFGGDGTDSFFGVAVDEKDDVYVSGNFSSTAFSIGAASFTNPTFADLGVVAKLNGMTGAPVWAKSFVPGRFGNGCNAIDYDSGRLVVTCSMGVAQQFALPDGGTGVMQGQAVGAAVYGLDPATGGVLWGKGFGTGGGADASAETYVQSIDVTATGTVVAGVFTGGSLTEKANNPAITIPQVGAKMNGFVTELSIQNPAVPLWAKGFGDGTGSGFVQSVSAAGTSASGVVVGGAFQGTISFGGAPHASVGDDDAFVMMLLNKAGAPEWEKYFGGNLKESLRRVRFDPCGRPELLFLTLSVLATTDGVAIPAPQPSSQAVASILAKLDPKDGRLLWAKGVAPGGNTDINGINQYDFGIELNGQSRVVGDFRGAVDLGGGQPASAVGGSHPYLIVYNP